MAKGVKLSAKIALDVVMLLILVLLYKAKVLTLTYHEVAGIGILLVFLVHCLFNWRWIANNAKKLFSPETPARTKFSYWISIALVLCFLMIVISGIFISKVLFKAQIEALAIDTSVFRTLHLFFSALSLILVGIHLGLYWGMVKGFFRKKFNMPAAIAKPVCYILLAVVVAFGIYSVPTSGFSQWLLCPVIPIEHGHGDHGSKGEATEQQETQGERAERSDRAEDQEAQADRSDRAEGQETQESQDAQAERSERSERDGHGDQAEQSTEAEGDAQSEQTDRSDRAERDGRTDDQAEQAEQTDRSDRGDRSDRTDQESGEDEGERGSHNDGEATDSADTDSRGDRESADAQGDRDGADSRDSRDGADSHGSESGKQKGSGNHGNNVELPNVLLTIAQFTSIVGLFAAITYYINEALRRRKKAAK